MKSLNPIEDKISLNIIYESQKVESSECSINDKIEKILISFAKKNNIEYSSLYILYNGTIFQNDSFKKTFFEIINTFDKKEKSMNILVYRTTNDTNHIKPKQENNNMMKNMKNMINIILIIDSKNPLILQGKREDKLKDTINKNSVKIGLNIESLTFKYGINVIDLNQKFDDFASDEDKKLSGITLSVYTKVPIKVVFVNNIDNNDNNDDRKIPFDCFLEDKIKNFCLEYCSKINKSIKDLSFKYENIEIKLNQTFYEMLKDKNNIDTSTIDIISNMNETNNDFDAKQIIQNIKEIEITVNLKSFLKRHKILLIIISSIIIILITALIIIFLIMSPSPSPPEPDPPLNDTIIETYPSDTIKITDIITNSIKITDIITNTIKITDIIINSINITNIIDTIKLTDKVTDKILPNPKKCELGYFIPYDDLTLEDCQKCSIDGCIKCNGTYEKNECLSCGDLLNIYDKNNKIIKCNITCETGEEEKCLTCDKIKNACSSCNIGYKLVNGICKPDYFIKAIFNTIQVGVDIELYHSPYSNNPKLEKMIIDGKSITPTKTYIFEEKGNHTVYYKFSKMNQFDTSANKDFFYYNINKNSDHLISVTFSDFDEYIPDLSFENMFYKRKDLISVDFSKISLFLNIDLSQIFYGCENLVYVNFDMKKSYFIVTELKSMFYDCKSLTTINLSKLNVTSVKSFRSMFKGCTSLESININTFKLNSATSIRCMFCNCNSLEYLDLSSFNSSKLEEMTFTFYNCKSLTSINLNNFRTSSVKDMDHLFYNCNSLKLVNLSSFNTEAVKNMDSMFEHCISLTSIIFGNSFITKQNPSMLSFLNNCHSLKDMNYPLYVHESRNLTAFFANCYSLTSVNLKNFDTSKVSNFNYMFYNCYNLKSIDISSFEFKNSAYTNYMFSGCFSLTSMDFSNFTKVMLFYSGMFCDCPNLKYLDFTIYNAYSTSLIFNSNISANGTLILGEAFKNYLNQSNIKFCPSNWTLITK